ncbi:MAG: hypothetical protein JW759_06570 [Candidatus Coatesbacteria bacterium]|nr:hypothetical protein [Candidatus Coatesbacteria bacterium]
MFVKSGILVLIICLVFGAFACQYAQRMKTDTTPFYQKRLLYGDELYGKIYTRDGEVYSGKRLRILANGTSRFVRELTIGHPDDRFYGLARGTEYAIRAKDIRVLEVLSPSEVLVTTVNGKKIDMELIPGIRNYQAFKITTYDFGGWGSEVTVPFMDVSKAILWSYSDSPSPYLP